MKQADYRQFEIACSEDMLALGAAMSQVMVPGQILFLQGNLGAGKTTFTRGAVQGMGFQGAVKSPTYTLVEPYETAAGRVYHFDLYRLADPEELEFIGGREYFSDGSICFVEWPDKGRGFLPNPDWVLNFYVRSAVHHLNVESFSQIGKAALARLKVK